MRDRSEEEAIESPGFTSIFAHFFSFFCCPNHLIQSLRIGTKLIQEYGGLFRVSQQAFAPFLRLMVCLVVSLTKISYGIQLCLQGLWLDATHQFADKLHLSAPGLMLLGRDRSINPKGITQIALREFDFLKLVFRESRQFLSECLKRRHFSFFCTFGRNLVGVIVDRFVIVRGAFIIHVCKV